MTLVPGKIKTLVLDEMPEVFVSNKKISSSVSYLVRTGKLRKLASRLYTRNMTDSPEALVARNIWKIVAGYFPGALVADRTAFEIEPSVGAIFLITATGQDIHLPGLDLRPRRGKGPLVSDLQFVEDNLYLSSRARAYLENLRFSRRRKGSVSRTLSRLEIEERLETKIRLGGIDGANRFRDEVRKVASELDMVKEATVLHSLVGTMLGTQQTRLKAPIAIARSKGYPYDPTRLDIFQKLIKDLRDHQLPQLKAPEISEQGRRTCAFFEAYFSNFIEGTKFGVKDAADIVFSGAMSMRPKDAHDIKGTWNIITSIQDANQTPKDVSEFKELLKKYHKLIMEKRPEARPGEFKQRKNHAGDIEFVDPDLVMGTLHQGFDFYRSLTTAFQRAVFMLFLVTEVHPFTDGNGRVARIMMNAELSKSGETRIIIPTIYRSNYLTALHALSSPDQRTEPLVRMLHYIQNWTWTINWRSLPETIKELEECNAFLESVVADREGHRLLFPQRPQVDFDSSV